MKTFKIEPIPAPGEASQAEPVYHVKVDGHPVIGLSDSEAKNPLATQLFAVERELARTLEPQIRLKRRLDFPSKRVFLSGFRAGQNFTEQDLEARCWFAN